jgi:hypothetical protein
MTGLEILKAHFEKGQISLERLEFLMEKYLKNEATVFDVMSIDRDGKITSQLTLIPDDEI